MNAYDERFAPVDSYEAGKSPYGLYHMAGNVQEWVAIGMTGTITARARRAIQKGLPMAKTEWSAVGPGGFYRATDRSTCDPLPGACLVPRPSTTVLGSAAPKTVRNNLYPCTLFPFL